MLPSAGALNIAKQFEKCRLMPYFDRPGPGGVLTAGWGHTGKDVVLGQMWTQVQADNALMFDMAGAGAGVTRATPGVTLNQNQFDACADFVFNEGIGRFMRSTLLKLLLAGDFDGAAAQFLVWDKMEEGGELVMSEGLLDRRKAEQALFLKPVTA